MLLIGLLLVLAAVAAGAVVTYDGAETTQVEFFGHTATASVTGIFFAGFATMLVLALGLWLMQGSFGRARRKRLARREARQEHRESVRSLEEEKVQLAEENARLEQQLRREQAATPAGGTVAAGAGPAREVRPTEPHTRMFGRNRDRDRDGVPDREEDSAGMHRAEPPAQ